MAKTKCGFENAPGGASGADLLAYYGPTIIVDIGFDPAHKADVAVTPPPVPGLKGIHALVDTGATESCIDSLLAAQLNLPVIDKRTVAGVHGAHPVNVYLAQVHVPSLKFTISGRFAGVDLVAGGQPHKALIGRTFLRQFTMIYEGRTGTVTISSDK
jgi:predicted aspartyl protease